MLMYHHGFSQEHEQLLGDVQLEGINPFLLQTDSKLSDNCDDNKRCPNSSGVEKKESSVTEFNGLMELDIS